ncbi:MAG: peptidase T [Thermomicrobiales bacterium]
MTSKFDQELEERFLRYVQIDTTSDERSSTSPSTERQFDLLHLLVEEMKGIGIQDVELTTYGAVLGTIPATIERKVPVVAFLAHVDTTAAFPGKDVKPIVHRHYDGGEIRFPDNQALVLSPETHPYLKGKMGDDIITASGATLLGADDKAGVAIVMAAAGHLLSHPEIQHGTIRVCFTPDEEIGRGVHADLPRDLKADVAYTFDGADLGEIVYETFSADLAVVHIEGVSIHPGQAKNVMVNALHLAAKIIMTLPHVTRTPDTTDGRQGFLGLYQMEGNAAKADMRFIIRDFERDGLQELGEMLTSVCNAVQATEPRATITCTITPQYRNMRYWLEEDMRPVELARQAAEDVGIDHFATPTRGGTDGSRLTEMGVPTPNLFTGMQEFHGPLEYQSVQDMTRATELCVRLAELWGGEAPA